MSAPDLDTDAEVEEVMSNFDLTVRDGAEEELRAGKWGRHAGWNFNGRVWFADGLFHEEVWHYREPVAEFSAPTLSELMYAVNAEWGSE